MMIQYMFVAILAKPVPTAPHPESNPWLDRNLMGNRSRTVLDAVDDTPLINRSQSISVGLQKCQFQRGAFEAMCCPIDISWGKSPILEFQLTFLEARVQYWSSNWNFLRQELILEFTPFTRARLCRLLSNWALAQASKYLFLVTPYLLTAGANILYIVQLFFLTTLKLSGCREDNIPLPQPSDTKVTSSQLCHHDNEYHIELVKARHLLLGFYF